MGSTVIFDPAARPALGRRVTQSAIRDFAATVEKRVTKGRSFDCLITGDAELRRLNNQFLRHDYATDVLSFPSGGGGAETLGDLAISADRALAQAADHGHSLGDELRILMLHGVLHLLGFDHESDEGEMARREARWRKSFALPHGLIERTAR